MRDISMFTTDLGAASLVLSQIPYTATAYIRIQSSVNGENFLQECTSFCMMAGAKKIYATGHIACKVYPYHNSVILMRANKVKFVNTDAKLISVTNETVGLWRSIYNEKAVHIDNSRYLTASEEQTYLMDGNSYFVYRNEQLLGVSRIEGNRIVWIASLTAGAGFDVLQATLSAISADTVELEVASTNRKALDLYICCGFEAVETLSDWYEIK